MDYNGVTPKISKLIKSEVRIIEEINVQEYIGFIQTYLPYYIGDNKTEQVQMLKGILELHKQNTKEIEQVLYEEIENICTQNDLCLECGSKLYLTKEKGEVLSVRGFSVHIEENVASCENGCEQF